MRSAVFQGFVESCSGGGAVGRRWWDLDEGKEWVDESSSVFDTCELGKAKALGDTLCIQKMVKMGKGNGQWVLNTGIRRGKVSAC